MNTTNFSYQSESSNRRGFSRADLIVTVAMVAVFAMLLPATGRNNSRSPAAQMESNLRQLTTAWTMYASDSRDKLVPNAETTGQPTSALDLTNPQFLPGGALAQWCPGRMKNLVTASNTAFLKIGLLYPYVQSICAYKDPSDTSRFPTATFGVPTSRSVSMNCWLGPLAGKDWNTIIGYSGTNHLRVFDRLSTVDQPGGPSRLFVFVVESPATIDDGFFLCDPNQMNTWLNLPATYHAGGSAISFADGHVSTRVWTDPLVLSGKTGSVSSEDLHWLQERSTFRDSQ